MLLSSVWWIGMGSLICSNNRLLEITTVALGGFALLDGMFGLFEPTPPWIYAMAGPETAALNPLGFLDGSRRVG